MINRTKQTFWAIAFLVLVLECLIFIEPERNWDRLGALSLSFQAACLIFMREDVKER